MGITFTKATISNPRQARRRALELEFLIDTGAIFSVPRGSIARKLALAKLDREEFTLADGTRRAYTARGFNPGKSRLDGKPGHPRGLADATVPGLVAQPYA
jgi:hypothetical protein